MDGWWDVEKLDEFFYRIFKSDLDQKLSKNWSDIIDAIMLRLFNYQTKEGSKEVGLKHYDLSNDFFKAMLDKRMIYSCGYWKNAKNLDEAQEHKLDLICRKLQLKPGMTVLDIGCGWGGFARYAAEKYGANVTGITISKEQYEFAQAHKESLPVTFIMKDYRDCSEQYDRILSIGMFEHVGNKNYREYMEVVTKCLKDDGLSLLHTIGSNSTALTPDPWIAKYIFPNSILPSLPQITEAANGLFVIEDIHNFGVDYDKTLIAWHANFINAWPQFKDTLGERFYRMWNYYLLSCAAGFRARGLQLWQVVLSKKGVEGGYDSIR
jgi:cyclopropane-fatty-acyl-phospholipid synthase